MKAVLLVGGYGTRMGLETADKPKPMVLVGGRPLVWHIMSHYARHGVKEFVLCLGYRGDVIKQFFLNCSLLSMDLTVNLATGNVTGHTSPEHDWKVTLVDTGLRSLTGTRIKRIAKFLDNETFFLTYGDVLSDVDIAESLRFHRAHGGLATVTAVQQLSRFGLMRRDGKGIVTNFEEKSIERSLVNGGYFVLESAVLDRIADRNCSFERHVLPGLARDRELHPFPHKGFWHPMDTLADKKRLDKLCKQRKGLWGVAPRPRKIAA